MGHIHTQHACSAHGMLAGLKQEVTSALPSQPKLPESCVLSCVQQDVSIKLTATLPQRELCHAKPCPTALTDRLCVCMPFQSIEPAHLQHFHFICILSHKHRRACHCFVQVLPCNLHTLGPGQLFVLNVSTLQASTRCGTRHSPTSHRPHVIHPSPSLLALSTAAV